ncbi:YkvA family protein [Scytonema sp. NUACC26]|uniref:YkvA family protein n=1 Tax=Scytonema sp. NUACC26 TaxID=3140176 RepID=UPI0034DC51DC
MHSLKQFAKKLKQEVYAVYLASKDHRVPWYTRALAVIIVAYAFSPIDLIPDPIPILGYLDDLIIIPLGIWLLLKLIPPSILSECRERAEIEKLQGKPINWIAAVVIIVIWLLLGIAIALLLNSIFALVK